MVKVLGFISMIYLILPSAAAQDVSATMSIDVRVVEGLSLSVSRSLDFGEVVAGTGLVRIDRESSDAGKFILRGSNNSTITVSYTLPANNALLRTEGEGTMPLNASIFGSTEDSPASAIELTDGEAITLSDTGEYYFFVEGSLEVGAIENNPAGTYAGLLTMVITYQ